MASVLSNGTSGRSHAGVQRRGGDPEPEELLTLLGDEHARQVLEAIADEPKSGGEIADALPLSRATVYRRLNDLEAAGLVAASTAICPDGHHHKEYRPALDSVRVGVRGGLSVSVAADDGGAR
jgi:DNA-binding transcriptional ArsR family regulator